MTPVATGPGSPVIAGAAVSGGEFDDFSDDDFSSHNIFDLSNSPDTLQSLGSLSARDPKAFLPQQDLAVGTLPDSPNAFYHDSSSESTSSKRAGSSTSSKTPVNLADPKMDEEDVQMEWGSHEYFGEEGAFPFGQDPDTSPYGTGPDSSSLNGMYCFEQDDGYNNQPFTFESPSNSPDMGNGSLAITSSPNVASANIYGTMQPDPALDHIKKSSEGKAHKKAASQFSANSIMNGVGTDGSREVSPMSNMVMSQDGSPTAVLNSPSPNFGQDLPSSLAVASMWAANLDGVADPVLDGVSNNLQFPNPQPSASTPPTYDFRGKSKLRILPTPLKSRVETQIPIKLTLTNLPPGVTKLHLPSHTISKPKLLAKPVPTRSADTLELFVSLVCTSAMDSQERRQRALERAASHEQNFLPSADDEENSPSNGGEVRICQGCITRERKRAARKKVKKIEEEKLWSKDEERRVVVFNTHEVKEWQPLKSVVDGATHVDSGREPPMLVDAPMRIACYCRHHGEKMGFNVIFTIKDFEDRVIAQAMSNPIMITDDHKTHPMAHAPQMAPSIPDPPVATAAPVNPPQQLMDNSSLIPSATNNFVLSPSNPDLSTMHHLPYNSSGKTTPTATSRTLSRPASPSLGGPLAKKRKSSSSRVPNGLTMTRLDTSPSPSHMAGAQLPTTTSPFTPNLNAPLQPDGLFGQHNGMFTTGPPTPSNDPSNFFGNNRSASMDNLAMAQLYSAPTSNHPSRAPSPNGLRNGVGNAAQQFNQALATNMFTLPMAVSQTRQPPVIHKIIPNEGPKVGGIEVTVLGAFFFQGLDVWFGDHKATTTTFWGDSSLVCLLPPSPIAGDVPVTFKLQNSTATQAFTTSKPPTFKYIDDNEDKLIRTALTVIGHKMSGQMLDVTALARRILSTEPAGWSGGSSGGPSSGGQMFTHAPYAHLESQLLKCLDLVDLDDSAHRTRLDLRSRTGHSMLHLSCSLGYHRFVAALLARGANPDARDKGGFTPLHVASIHNHPEIVRRLMLNGADPTIRSLSGLTAADVAQSRGVVRAIRRSERHVRSRSGGSLHSRASSATSLRSLWEPMTKVQTHQEPLLLNDSGEESPEYTSGDLEDADSEEDAYLSMRRSSVFRQERERPNLHRQNTGELEEDLAPPAMALAAALKDQFQQQLQQFQQTMALHFQNLPHFPQMPQMPDYQALQQRMQQLMPGMSGTRPNSAGEESRDWATAKTGENAPPAYDELFPRKDLETKDASAAQAACEAEADMKCATLFDTPTSAPKPIETKTQVPSILKIGRKNAITKEQQEQFLAAHEVKMKRLSSDRNLFFVWIPLLLVMVALGLYSYFPSLFSFAWAFARSLLQTGTKRSQQFIQRAFQDRIVEV